MCICAFFALIFVALFKLPIPWFILVFLFLCFSFRLGGVVGTLAGLAALTTVLHTNYSSDLGAAMGAAAVSSAAVCFGVLCRMHCAIGGRVVAAAVVCTDAERLCMLQVWLSLRVFVLVLEITPV